MSRPTQNDLLLKLGDPDLNHHVSGDDLRNRKVLGADGQDIGHVSALFLDRTEGKVRFLQVGIGGFLGLGEREFLIPVEAITSTDPAEVHVRHTREQVLAEPHYDQYAEVGRDQTFWAAYYGHYGHSPYWTSGD